MAVVSSCAGLRRVRPKQNMEHILLIGRKGGGGKVSAFLGYTVPSVFFLSKTKAELVNLPLRFINWKSACIMPFHFGML